jgi:hypothetical protein
MKRTLIALSIATLPLVGLEACSLLVPNDLSGGPPDAIQAPGTREKLPNSDGGSGAQSTFAADATSDAKADAKPSSGGCAHWFCDSFEAPAIVGSGWDLFEQGAGPLSYDSAAAANGQRSLLVVVAPGSAYRRSYLGKVIATPVSSAIRVEAAFRVDAREPGTTADLADILLKPPPPGFSAYDVWLIADGANGLTLKAGVTPTGGAASYPSQALPAVDLSQFRRVAVSLVVEPTQLVAKVDVDGAVLGTLTLPQAAVPNAQVAIGVPFTGGKASSGWTVRADDVWIDQQ